MGTEGDVDPKPEDSGHRRLLYLIGSDVIAPQMVL
jgi:hypothetical protein